MSRFEVSPRERLLAHESGIDPSIIGVLEHVSDALLRAYASAEVQHNTLGGNVSSILEHGLIPGYAASTPDPEDVAFARELMHHPELYTPEKERKFDIYVAGTKDERGKGVFLSVIQPNSHGVSHNVGYGLPERMMILMSEMGAVMLGEASFDTDIRNRAASIYEKYRERLYGEGHIAVLEVDPFSPAVINTRLNGLAGAYEGMDEEMLALALPLAGGGSYEGLYVPEAIPPQDIRDTGISEPLPNPPEPQADLSRSRFYSPARPRG